MGAIPLSFVHSSSRTTPKTILYKICQVLLVPAARLQPVKDVRGKRVRSCISTSSPASRGGLKSVLLLRASRPPRESSSTGRFRKHGEDCFARVAF